MRMWVPLLAILVACGSKEDASPVANAGPDQVVTPGVSVLLDGTGSSDRDGRIKNYAWTMLSAPGTSTVGFEGSGPTPGFTADAIGRYVFSLVVTDDAGNVSYPDVVEIVAVAPADRPIAHLETYGDLGIGLPITLDGRGSSAPEGSSITVWNFSFVLGPAGSAAVIETGEEPGLASFTPDVEGVWIAGLEVSDGELASRVATVQLNVSSEVNQPPVAVCGGDQAISVGSTAYVNGGASIDPEGQPLTYHWSLSAPGESAAVMIGDESATGRFVADIAGEFVATLVVSDGILHSNPCTTTITSQASLENRGPVAHAGSDKAVESTTVSVGLDGSASFDPDGDPLNYRWHLLSTPPSSLASDASFDTPEREATLFSPDTNGVFIVGPRYAIPVASVRSMPLRFLLVALATSPPWRTPAQMLTSKFFMAPHSMVIPAATPMEMPLLMRGPSLQDPMALQL